MDASTHPTSPACDQCGYPRTGLPATALCPECGEPPPRAAATTAADPTTPTLTAAHLAQVRAVAIGLVLLVVASVTALGVTLVMDVGPPSLAALNVPAPKVFGAALVQRSIGGRPGPWGVSGTTAALLAVVAVWLITTPRSLNADEEHPFSPRRLARWASVLTVGAALGLLLSGADPYIPPRGDRTASWILLLVAFCELPANALLYVYLRQLARESADRRAAAALDRVAWILPILVAGAAAILLYAGAQRAAQPSARWPLPARAGVAVYAAVAIALGAAATAAVLRLTAVYAHRGFATWAAAAPALLARFPRLVRCGLHALRQSPARWAVCLGIVLWLAQYWKLVGHMLEFPLREGTRGEVPMLDFPGPKVPVSALAGAAARRYHAYGLPHLQTALAALAAIWLVTWERRTLKPPPRTPADLAPPVPPPSKSIYRLIPSPIWTRRLILVLCGAALAANAFDVARAARDTFSHTRVVAFAITALETLATALVYLNLAAVAAAINRPDLAKRLAIFGLVAAALDLLPLGPFGTNPHEHERSFGFGLICAAQAAAMFVITFFCIGALTRLAWALATREPAPK